MASSIPDPERLLYDRLHRDPEVLELIDRSDAVLGELGYTDHGRRHVTVVAVTASRVLAELGMDAEACDRAAVAGLLHDIGNVDGRDGHARRGADMALALLIERGVPDLTARDVSTAVANHDEIEGGGAVSPTSAALILADKSDIHRSRVRTRRPGEFDVHDRVNHAVTRSRLSVRRPESIVELSLTVDEGLAGGGDVVKLFADRFAMCVGAARLLGCEFRLEVNGRAVPVI